MRDAACQAAAQGWWCLCRGQQRRSTREWFRVTFAKCFRASSFSARWPGFQRRQYLPAIPAWAHIMADQVEVHCRLPVWGLHYRLSFWSISPIGRSKLRLDLEFHFLSFSSQLNSKLLRKWNWRYPPPASTLAPLQEHSHAVCFAASTLWGGS